MNIQEELHKVFPVPKHDVIDYLEASSGPLDERLYLAEAHARFFQHLKSCVTTKIARHKNMDANSEIMAAIMSNDVQALSNTENVL